MSAVDSRELSLLTHYDSGRGVPFVMLHPGGVDARALDPIVEQFTDRFHIYSPDQRGHGRTPDAPREMTFEAMADDTIAFIDGVVGGAVQLLGYSDGATVALLVALKRPDLVRNLVFVAGVFHRDGWLDGVLDGEPAEFMADLYAEASPDGREHYADIVAKLDRMHAAGPQLDATDLATVHCPVLVMVGDDDEMSLEHVVSLYRALPLGELAVIPHASHGVLVEKPRLCALIIADFLEDEKPDTFAPIRRSHPERGQHALEVDPD
jgi:pimeloyl-ACP methyl ester carboxylesterase